MKPSTIKFYLTCIFLCAPFFINAQETSTADSLFLHREYLQARVAYERILFGGKRDVNEIILKKSYCLKAEGKYEEAYTALQRADFFNGDDSLKFKLYYESVLNSFLAGKYDLTLNKIKELHYYLPNMPSLVIDLLEILTLNQQQKFSLAEEKYNTVLSTYHINKNVNAYQNINRKIKNPEKAESISHLLPGFGQMYAGYPGQGITSLVIQSGLVAFSVYSFIHGYYFSGAFTGVGLFYIFNNGGARHAQYLAEKRNAEVISKLNIRVKNALLEGAKK